MGYLQSGTHLREQSNAGQLISNHSKSNILIRAAKAVGRGMEIGGGGG